jgi:hypothetical protein
MSGCASTGKEAAPFVYSPTEYAILIGKISYLDDGWFTDEVADGGLLIRRLPLQDGQEPEVEVEDITVNKNGYRQTRLWGGLSTYYLKPGKYIVLPYSIRFGNQYASLVRPPKENALIGVLTCPFSADFWTNPHQWLVDHNQTYANVILGQLTIRAGEVVYFGDVMMGENTSSLHPFITSNKMDAARDHLKKSHPELAGELQFRPWSGSYFLPPLAAEKKEASPKPEDSAKISE